MKYFFKEIHFIFFFINIYSFITLKINVHSLTISYSFFYLFKEKYKGTFIINWTFEISIFHQSHNKLKINFLLLRFAFRVCGFNQKRHDWNARSIYILQDFYNALSFPNWSIKGFGPKFNFRKMESLQMKSDSTYLEAGRFWKGIARHICMEVKEIWRT